MNILSTDALNVRRSPNIFEPFKLDPTFSHFRGHISCIYHVIADRGEGGGGVRDPPKGLRNIWTPLIYFIHRKRLSSTISRDLSYVSALLGPTWYIVSLCGLHNVHQLQSHSKTYLLYTSLRSRIWPVILCEGKYQE